MNTRTLSYGLGAFLLLSSAACDDEGKSEAAASGEEGAEAKAEAEAEGEAAVSGDAKLVAKADFDLESVSYMVRKGKVKDAKALEKQINSKKEGVNKIDIDGDGKIDKIAVVEVRKDGKTTFELKVLPSSKAKQKKDPDVYVTIAFIELEPVEDKGQIKVEVYYADVIDHSEEDFYTFEFEAKFSEDTVVVEDAVFISWVYTSRPVYVSSLYYVEVHIEEEGCWPPGHCKHVVWGPVHHGHVEIYFGHGGHYKHKKGHGHFHGHGHGKW